MNNKKLDEIDLKDIHFLLKSKHYREIKDLDVGLFEKAKRKLLKECFFHERYRLLKVYRAVSIPYFIEAEEALVEREDIGVCWTYDIESAHIMRDIHKEYGDTYILETLVNEMTVDWGLTLALHMIPVRGNYEREIRLKDNQQIVLNKIYDSNHKDFLDGKVLKNFRFFTEKGK